MMRSVRVLIYIDLLFWVLLFQLYREEQTLEDKVKDVKEIQPGVCADSSLYTDSHNPL